jgi:hypothetical protein
VVMKKPAKAGMAKPPGANTAQTRKRFYK